MSNLFSMPWAEAHNAKIHAAKFPKDGADRGDAFEGLENDLHRQIIEELQRRRWVYIRSRMDKKSTSTLGQPDFVIAAPNGIAYWIEVKRKGGKLSKNQSILKHLLLSSDHRWACVYSLAEFIEFVKSE